MEDNKLIAEFLGYKPNTNGVYPIVCINEGKGWHLETMKFNYDWNWLMQVVEKIESFGHDVFINTCLCRITDVGLDIFEDIECFVNNNKRQATYNACVEFVKWYNEQNK
jgi:hypothetical protein